MSYIWVFFLISFLMLVFCAVLIQKNKGFWNDEDGISITDWLTGVFAFGYFLVTGVIVQKVLLNNLNNNDLGFFQHYSWPMMTILGGYFGNKIVKQLTSNRPTTVNNTQIQSEQSTKDDLEGRV